mmetsp:Transcript_13665/g.33043  ORF Transcript_13665/g.33043 Transcript_13665/m.33043 type:complete len:213 (-) Transcript_13665:1975-2613(-)
MDLCRSKRTSFENITSQNGKMRLPNRRITLSTKRGKNMFTVKGCSRLWTISCWISRVIPISRMASLESLGVAKTILIAKLILTRLLSCTHPLLSNGPCFLPSNQKMKSLLPIAKKTNLLNFLMMQISCFLVWKASIPRFPRFMPTAVMLMIQAALRHRLIPQILVIRARRPIPAMIDPRRVTIVSEAGQLTVIVQTILLHTSSKTKHPQYHP